MGSVIKVQSNLVTFLRLMQNWECVKSIFFYNITLLCNQIGTLFEGDIAFYIYIYIYIYIYCILLNILLFV